jgi:hypothetical protein
MQNEELRMQKYRFFILHSYFCILTSYYCAAFFLYSSKTLSIFSGVRFS